MRQVLLGLALLLAALPAQAQLWSSILDDTRGADWTSAGVTGGIPTGRTQCGSTIAAYSGAATTINNAIAACGANQYVLLGAGTFTLSSGILFANKSNVTLRGMGADQTYIDMNGSVSCNGLTSSICVRSSTYLEGTAPPNSPSWTANYGKGDTVITVSSTTNLAVGRMVFLTQDNDSSDPGVGTEFICSATGVCSNGSSGGGGNPGSQEQLQITTVSGISGSDVTLNDPILANNWRSGQSPEIWYISSNPATGVGLEDFHIDCAGCGSASNRYNILLMHVANSWVKGVKSRWAPRNHVDFWETSHCTVRDSYMYESNAHSSTSYGVECIMGSHNLVENNIVTNVTAAFMQSGSCSGGVWGYNYSKDATYTSAGWQQIDHYYHGTGSSHNLHEGNIGIGIISDNVHGPSAHITAFRNYFRGRDNSCAGSACTAQTNPVHIYSQSRFFNAIGNVLGDNAYHNKYESYTGNTSNCYTSAYQMDFSGNACDTVTYASDSSVRTGTMRWGNYDTVGDTTRWESSEVPSAITGNYDNAVPGDQNLPDSFYLSARPDWFGHEGVAVEWPPIGPDVTGGDLANLGGHVHSNPAKLCYDNSTFSGNEITDFNAATCYEAVSAGPPAAPTNFRVIGTLP